MRTKVKPNYLVKFRHLTNTTCDLMIRMITLCLGKICTVHIAILITIH
jgi:hypothetical protein